MKNYLIKYKTSNAVDATIYGVDMEGSSVTDVEKKAKDQFGQSAIIVSISEDEPYPETTTMKILVALLFVVAGVSIYALIKLAKEI